MSNKRFVLGLGHQKCGTSWLHAYLKMSGKFDGGCKKEYHIWDALDIPLLAYNKISHVSIRDRIKHHIRIHGEVPNYIRYRMQSDESFYFKYFSSLYTEDIEITGDISPSYSALSAERLCSIRDCFDKIGISVLPIVLTRNPLHRIKSAVRFNLDRKNYDEGIDSGESDFERALLQYYKSEHCEIRTRYFKIIQSLDKAFGRDQFYVGFYESMFTEREMERLSNFIGIEPNLSFASVRINKTRSAVFETQADAVVREHYADVYEYFYTRFPETLELWN